MKQKRKFDNEDGERRIKYASELPYSKKWKQYVPNTGDFNQHGVEFMIDPLSIGSYILLAYDSSESKNFVRSCNPFPTHQHTKNWDNFYLTLLKSVAQSI